MIVLGIDPSFTATGLAWRLPKHAGRGPGDQWRTFLERGDDRPRIREVIALAASEGASAAWIEDVFAGPNRKVSLRLAGLGGEMRAWCIAAGLEVQMIQAREWQKAMLGIFEKGEHKEASKDAAEGLGADINRYTLRGLKVRDDNMADAVNLSEYGRLNS